MASAPSVLDTTFLAEQKTKNCYKQPLLKTPGSDNKPNDHEILGYTNSFKNIYIFQIV